MERFKISKKEIMKLSYVDFIIMSADCPSPDYSSKKNKKKTKPETAKEQVNSVIAALG